MVEFSKRSPEVLRNEPKCFIFSSKGGKNQMFTSNYPAATLSFFVFAISGDSNRSVGATKMNTNSSRSHLLLLLKLHGTNRVTNAVTRGTLTLVDLAGSERISKTEATGQRLVEAAAINKSLSALGQVFAALRTNAMHVPYRNSKLTQLMQSSLGGDGKACLFVNVSPLASNLSETASTLQFGSAAKQVELGKAKQNIT